MLHYTYDGTFVGFLSVVFCIYETKQPPSNISADGAYQTDLFAETVFVPSDDGKAERVEKGLTSKIGQFEFSRIINAFCCDREDEKDMKIFSFIRLALKVGKAACEMYSLATVCDFNALVLKADKEIQHMQGFLRFRAVNCGLFVAEYAPDNDITLFLTRYFSARNANDKFIIRDVNREVYGLYNGSECTVVYGDNTLKNFFEDLVYTEDELIFRDIWQQYYDTVAVSSRRNERLRSQYMPRRYWKYLTELCVKNQ